MRRFLITVSVLLFSNALFAADEKSFFYLDSKDLPVEETSFIRPAVKNELKKSTKSAWARGLTGEPGTDQIPTFLAISPAENEQEKASLKGYQSVRAPGGSYKLFARCKGRGVVLTFDGVIIVEKAKRYIVSCTGTTVARTRLVAVEEP